jgi:hypothetical protein
MNYILLVNKPKANKKICVIIYNMV